MTSLSRVLSSEGVVAALYVETGVVNRLNRKLVILPGSGCFLWRGYRNKKGYGTINVAGKPAYTHRVAWQAENGPIPDGLCILHRCDNPACCNPGHMSLGTKADNNADMRAKGRARQGAVQAAQTHCKNGHLFDAANTRFRNRRRICKACAREWMRNARAEGRHA